MTVTCYHSYTDRTRHTQRVFDTAKSLFIVVKFANQKLIHAYIFCYDQLTHKMLMFNYEGSSSNMYLNLAENYTCKEIKVWLSNVFIGKKSFLPATLMFLKFK